MNNEIMVTIPLDDYTSLVEERKEYWILIDAIFSNCELNYRRDDLNFRNIDDMLKMIQPSMYENKLKALKKEYEGSLTSSECEVNE